MTELLQREGPLEGAWLSRATEDELVEALRECQTRINQLSAAQIELTAEIARRDLVRLEDGTVGDDRRPLGHVSLGAAEVVADAVSVSPSVGAQQVETAVVVARSMPRLLASMVAGHCDRWRAQVVVGELAGVAHEVIQRVDERIGGALEPRLRAGGVVGVELAGPLRRRVRQVVAALDDEGVAERAASARQQRRVQRWASGDGMDTWQWRVPAAQSLTAWEALEARARTLHAEGETETLDQARSDAMFAMLLGGSAGSWRVVISVPAAAAGAAGPAGAAGHAGPAASRAPAAFSASAAAASPGISTDRPPADEVVRATVRSLSALPKSASVIVGGVGRDQVSMHAGWVLDVIEGAESITVRECHSDTGARLASEEEASGTAYRPPERLRAAVRERDQRCRVPGCTVPAVRCDLDHVRPWPLGPTEYRNLMCLCRRHHRLKQSVGWSVRLAEDFSVVWTYPTGRRVVAPPPDQLAGALPAAVDIRDLAPEEIARWCELPEAVDVDSLPPWVA